VQQQQQRPLPSHLQTVNKPIDQRKKDVILPRPRILIVLLFLRDAIALAGTLVGIIGSDRFGSVTGRRVVVIADNIIVVVVDVDHAEGRCYLRQDYHVGPGG